MTRFMHFSDTHLGNREYMMDEREDDFYESFQECLKIAIENRVDFIVHSGDLFDTWSPSNRALSVLKEGMRLLDGKGIPVYTIMGDHDRPRRTDFPAAKIFDFLGMRLLGADGLETIEHDAEVLISGISNLKGTRREMLPAFYQKADQLARGKKKSVLISHQGVEGFAHPEDVQVRAAQLPKNYSYLAFGHIHVSAFRETPFPFAYAGSTEITSSSEIESFLAGGKGVNIVDLNGDVTEVRRERITSPRIQFKVTSDLEHYEEELEKSIAKYASKEMNKKPLVLSEVHGTSDFPAVRKIMMRFSDSLIFRRPVLVKQSAPATINLDKLDKRSIFNEYFGKNSKLTDLAMDIYSLVGTADQDSVIEEIASRAIKEVNRDDIP